MQQRDQRLHKFAPIFRERIAALTCCAPQAEDLIDSFPALLVALISDFGSGPARAKAFEIIIDGGSIKLAAKALGLPIWLKKMPAEAFQCPIHALPCEPQFTAKISNFVPDPANGSGAGGSRDWLDQVTAGSETCDSLFALWVAKHCGSIAASRRRKLFALMAAWAWHAKHPGTVGYRLIEKPWSTKMGLRRATEELMRWRRRAELACIIDDGIQSTWLEPGYHDGLHFVPLRSLDEFLEESRIMNNCLDQYADRLSTGLIRIFSIRSGSRPIADIEVGPVPTTGGLPTIVQIKGPSNRRAPPRIWQASRKWLAAQPGQRMTAKPGPVRSPDAQPPSFWLPYLEWLPESRRADLNQALRPCPPSIDLERLPHPLLSVRSSAPRADGPAE